MKKINFTKTVASGNDFIIIENNRFSTSDLKMLARYLCRAKYGIGADGLLVSEKSKVADLRMRIFNSDGTEAEMCGNGIRCFLLWAYTGKHISKDACIETASGLLYGNVKKKGFIKVKLAASFKLKTGIKIILNKKTIKGDYINTGVPHFVVVVKNIEDIDVIKWGKLLRYHNYFKPAGTNVDFVEYKRNKLHIRTYERGVEGETLACGTGAVASALVYGYNNGYINKEIVVVPRSKEEIKASYKLENEAFRDVFLEGMAKILFKGESLI